MDLLRRTSWTEPSGATSSLPRRRSRRHVKSAQLRQEVVIGSEVTGGPQETRCRRFRARFHAELYRPFNAVAIADHELGVVLLEIFLEERERRLWLVLTASRPVEQVPIGNVGGLTPEHRANRSGSFYAGVRFFASPAMPGAQAASAMNTRNARRGLDIGSGTALAPTALNASPELVRSKFPANGNPDLRVHLESF